MDKDYSPKMAVIVSSCDRYADLLEPFHQVFTKYWPDCQYRKVLVTQSKPETIGLHMFDHIDAWGVDMPWTQRLLYTLRALSTPYFLLILDDFFMSGMFSNAKAEHYLDILQEKQGAGIRLTPLPKPKRAVTSEYGEYPIGQAYRVSAQVGIWNREYMILLLEDLQASELWNFERYGSLVSEKYISPSFGTYQTVFPYTEVICFGRWLAGGLRFIENEGITIDRSRRAAEPWWFLLYREARGIVFRLNPTLVTKIVMKLSKEAGK